VLFRSGKVNTKGLKPGQTLPVDKKETNPELNKGDNPDLQTSGTNEEPKKERVDKGRTNGSLALVKEKQYKDLISDFDAYLDKGAEGDENYINFKREEKKETKSNWEGIKYTNDIGNIYIQHDAINSDKINPVVIFSNEKILYDALDQGLFQGLINTLKIDDQTLLDRIKWKNK
jgi:hypothetical protein